MVKALDESRAQTFRWCWTPNWPLLLFGVVMLPVLVVLGFWQLARAEEKRELQAVLDQRQTQAPIEWVGQQALPTYTQLYADGRFLAPVWLLDNRQRDGRVGYEVVQLFEREDGKKVLVNRGWLPAESTRQQLPVVPLTEATLTLFAAVAPLSDHPLLDSDAPQGAWPRIITEIEPAKLFASLDFDSSTDSVTDYYLNIDAASSGALRTGWTLVNMSAAKHTGYAVQWFAMAIALLLLTLWANTNLGGLLQRRKNK